MKNLSKSLVTLGLMTTVLFSSSDLNIINFKKAKGMFTAKSALFMDARGFKLYQKGTILGAVHVPNKQLGKNKKIAQRLPIDLKTKIVSFCNGFKCEESDHLARKLTEKGYEKVYVYKGGFPEWKEKKQPIMSLQKECKVEKKGTYQPKGKKVQISGANIFLGGESPEDGMIDQFWFADLVNNGNIPSDIQIVDVRKAKDYKENHLPGAINVTWDSENEKIDSSKLPKDKLVVFYCNTGMMSTDARNSLSDKDASNVLIFDANFNCKEGKCSVTANENL